MAADHGGNEETEWKEANWKGKVPLGMLFMKSEVVLNFFPYFNIFFNLILLLFQSLQTCKHVNSGEKSLRPSLEYSHPHHAPY